MNSASQDPFQHNYHHHTRQSSIQTVYEDNDPYRIIKKSPRLDSISDNNLDFDAIHSRTASDSSTNRLYERANSYLPYSHHKRDPNQKNEPIYIEEEYNISTSLGVNSMLQDNLTDHYNISIQQKPQQQQQQLQHIETELKKRNKKRKKKCCGLRYLTITVILFLFIIVIIVIWYFVWPRIPNLTLNNVDNIGSIQVITNSTIKSMSTNWLINMTADNTANWIPTSFNSIDLVITDDHSVQNFGNGTSGWIVLPPRKKSILAISMSIYYASSIVNDTTFQDLYNACGVQVNSNIPFDNQQDVLNVTLHVTYHIAGIIWSTTKQMPIRGLICPTS